MDISAIKNKKLKNIIITAIVFALIFLLVSCDLSWLFKGDKYTPPTRGNSITSTEFVPHFINETEREETPYRYIEDDSVNKGTVNLSALPTDTTSATAVNSALKTLLDTVVSGKRPIVSDDEDNPVTQVYTAALDMLNDYMLNDFSDFERAHTIYDWVVYYINYDYALLDEYMEKNGQVNGNNPAFHLSGAFLSGLAVCDGISQAYTLLCAMEGIQVERVIGWAPSEDNAGRTVYVGHAWNKIKIEVPEVDGENWFFVDPTFGSAAVDYGKIIGYREYLNHAYFLLTDTESDDHFQDDSYTCNYPYTTITQKIVKSKATYAGGGNMIYSVADTEFDFYAYQTNSYGDKEMNMVANSREELCEYIKDIAVPLKMKGVEIKIAFEIDPDEFYGNRDKEILGELNDLLENIWSTSMSNAMWIACGKNYGILMLIIIYK